MRKVVTMLLADQISSENAEDGRFRYEYDIFNCNTRMEAFDGNISVEGRNNMSDYNYDIIKHAVIDWYEKASSGFNKNGEITLSKNNDEALIIDFDLHDCVAQLSVTDSQFVPYQYVYFEAMDIITPGMEEAKPIYCFYDDSTMQKNDVIDALNEAIKFCSTYKKM